MQTTPKLDTQKLRRLIQERRRRLETARARTDEYIELKRELGHLEHSIQRKRDEYPGGQANDQDIERAKQMREELADLAEEREAAGQAFQAMSYVERLVAHARRQGYDVDEISGSVHAARPPAKPATGKTGGQSWDGFDPRAHKVSAPGVRNG